MQVYYFRIPSMEFFTDTFYFVSGISKNCKGVSIKANKYHIYDELVVNVIFISFYESQHIFFVNIYNKRCIASLIIYINKKLKILKYPYPIIFLTFT